MCVAVRDHCAQYHTCILPLLCVAVRDYCVVYHTCILPLLCVAVRAYVVCQFVTIVCVVVCMCYPCVCGDNEFASFLS